LSVVEFDWTTFTLEIINFLILVWILKRFLYHPVLDVIAKRRDGIEKALADARRIETEATGIKQQHERNLAEWGEQKEAAEASLLQELASERERRMAALDSEIAEERERRRVLDERQQRDFEHMAEERAIAHGTAFSARLLARVATPELEGRLYALLLEDLRSLCAEDRRTLAEVAVTPGVQFRVQSAFRLDESKRAELARVLAEVTGKTLPVEYRENPELVAGFHVHVGPWILHANLRDELKFFSGALRHAG
jgi:F-type H+-transporting ATPase subunit b